MNSRKVLDVKIILYDSYFQAIKNSVGSNLFRNLYAYVDGKRMDIRDDGRLSCSAFVSSILYLHKLIRDVHATAEGVIKDMENFGWEKIAEAKPGAVLVWESLPPKDHDDKFYWQHDHIGFYIGDNQSVTHLDSQRQPAIHHWTFGEKEGKPVRNIETVYWHKQLDKNEIIKNI